MGIEIERKFLLKNAEWRKLTDSVVEIKQGYLNSHIDRTVRIRITGDQAFLTVKGKNKGSIRKEFEYEIPKAEGLSQLELCEQPIISKKRYLVNTGDHTWEIDEFAELNEGLIVAEIELTSGDEVFKLPNWIGREVTEEVQYYNSSLIQRPYKDWKES